MNDPTPAEPAGFVRSHSERRFRRDQELAESFGGPPAPPAPPPIPPPVPRQPTEGVRPVVTRSRSGAVLTTYVGREPRTDVETPKAGRGRQEMDRERLLAANIRHNRRCRHLEP